MDGSANTQAGTSLGLTRAQANLEPPRESCGSGENREIAGPAHHLNRHLSDTRHKAMTPETRGHPLLRKILLSLQ